MMTTECSLRRTKSSRFSIYPRKTTVTSCFASLSSTKKRVQSSEIHITSLRSRQTSWRRPIRLTSKKGSLLNRDLESQTQLPEWAEIKTKLQMWMALKQFLMITLATWRDQTPQQWAKETRELQAGLLQEWTMPSECHMVASILQLSMLEEASVQIMQSWIQN